MRPNKRFDTRWVFRTILNSKAYQRESRYLSDPKQYFSATRPSQLRNDQIAKSLNQVIGNKLDRQVRSAFAVDLSMGRV